MRTLELYLKDQIRQILIVAVMLVTMIILFILNRVPKQEIIYAVVIMVFMYLVYLFVYGYRWIKKYNIINSLKNIEASNDYGKNLEKYFNDSVLEKMYVELVEKIFNDIVHQQNNMATKQRDMQDYYSMWVHQIKTPIAAMKILLEQENEEGQNNQKLAELFRIEQYVEMALQYVRIDSEDTDFVFANNKLEPIVRSAVRKYARLFISKKIALDFDMTEVSVLTDAKWIGFVIEQLLSNAVKYTANGSVVIRTENEDEKTKLIIKDTGIGIRSEDLPRICEKGYTGYNGHANEHSTGIGLYLCNQIINKLGHKMNISSTEGVGTKVEIIF